MGAEACAGGVSMWERWGRDVKVDVSMARVRGLDLCRMVDRS